MTWALLGRSGFFGSAALGGDGADFLTGIGYMPRILVKCTKPWIGDSIPSSGWLKESSGHSFRMGLR